VLSLRKIKPVSFWIFGFLDFWIFSFSVHPVLGCVVFTILYFVIVIYIHPFKGCVKLYALLCSFKCNCIYIYLYMRDIRYGTVRAGTLCTGT
jgi:hypothetical protein